MKPIFNKNINGKTNRANFLNLIGELNVLLNTNSLTHFIFHYSDMTYHDRKK